MLEQCIINIDAVEIAKVYKPLIVAVSIQRPCLFIICPRGVLSNATLTFKLPSTSGFSLSKNSFLDWGQFLTESRLFLCIGNQH